MNSVFIENYCRICHNFFCCLSCRLNHEENAHNIDPNCDICVYGQVFLKEPSQSILSHWKAQHWPLHCVLCKTVFTTQRDLVIHMKCPGALSFNENFNMVVTSLSDINYDSPPITATVCKADKQFVFGNIISVTTSTPMNNSEKELIEHISEGIAPVDYCEHTGSYDKIGSVTSAKPEYTPIYEETKNTESSKRRVTFCETPIVNYEKDQFSITDSKFEEFATASEELINSNLHKEHIEIINEESFAANNLNTSKIDISQSNVVHNLNSLIIPNDIKTNFFLINNESNHSSLNEKNVIHNDEYLVNLSESEIKEKQITSNSMISVFMTPDLNCDCIECTESKFNTKMQQHQNVENMTEDQFISAKYKTAGTESKAGSSTSVVNFIDYPPVVPEKQGIWFSMASIVKNSIRTFSESTKTFSKNQSTSKKADTAKENLQSVQGSKETAKSNKRSKPETEASTEETPIRKRIKLSDVKCRKAIHHLGLLYMGKKRITNANKSTQTD